MICELGWPSIWEICAPMGVQYLFLGPLWRSVSTKNRKKGIQKGMQKSMPKKYWKLMPKGSQNDAKMDAQIHDFLSFFKKTKYMKSSPRSDGSMILQVLGTWKCMTNRYKIDARKRYAKNTENYAKMDPKWKPKSLDKLKRWEKRHQKWEPKKHMIFGKVLAESRREFCFPRISQNEYKSTR